MGSSGGGGGGYYPGAYGAASPMPGLPVAGADSTIGDPYEYGKFQNFLPDIKAEGINDMATGLRPHMFNYTKPNPGGGVLPGNSLAGGGGAPAAAASQGNPVAADPNQTQALRDQLAALTAGGGRGDGGWSGRGPFTPPLPQYLDYYPPGG